MSSGEINEVSSNKISTNDTSAAKAGTLSSNNIVTASSDEINKVSSDKININTTSAAKAETPSSNNIVTTSSDEIVVKSSTNIPTMSHSNNIAMPPGSTSALSTSNTIAFPNNTTTAHFSEATTFSTKRKQVSPDAQGEAHRPLKKGRADRDFDFIRDTFGYTFKDLNLLDEALDTTGLYRPQSNQSLALIGDSILQLTIYRDWYPSRQLKGTGNQLVQTIGCNAKLAKVATRIGLDKYIVTAQGITPPHSLLATTMEAVLGAIDCDSGEDADAVRKAMYMVGLTLAGTY